MVVFPSLPKSAKPWEHEKIYFDGDDYFRDLLTSINTATRSIDFEIYAFEPGTVGDKIISALMHAAKRGVKIKILVDGVGSPSFVASYGETLEKHGIKYKAYRSWQTFFSTVYRRFRFLHFLKFAQDTIVLFDSGTHRDHRKQIIIDDETVWTGSFNISDCHSKKEKGKTAWRDTGIRLTGVKSSVFTLAFHVAWEDPWPHHFRKTYRRSLIRELSNRVEGSLVRMTMNRKLRRSFRRELLDRIRNAKQRIWIMTPYFIPTRRLLRTLTDAARRGVEVDIMLPSISDVPMVRWASMVFYPRLLSKGCRLFEYQGSFLHAKTTAIDSWVLVGSSNLNYRSLHNDMEINVLPHDATSVKQLENQFRVDKANCHEITLDEVRKYPFWIKILSWFFFQFRFWF